MERERITISIKKKLLNAIDRTIDGINIRNRSHAIETLSTSALNLDTPNYAVILVGGEDAIKTIPQVKENIKKMAESGFDKIYIAVGYLAKEIKNKIGDGSNFNVEIEYLEGGEGSAGAILPLKEEFDKTFFVLNNISIKKFDLDRLLECHQLGKTISTVITDNLDNLNGLYICEPIIFDYIPKGFSMFETDVFPKLYPDQNICIKPVSGK